MPVSCKFINGKYRIIGPSGTIETNADGSAVDGGGHSTMELCQKQARAINANAASILIQDPDSQNPFELASSQSTNAAGLPIQKFKKELISIGNYTHPIHGWKLRVTNDRMKKWVAGFNSMSSNGVDVEIVKDHSLKADDVVGYLTDMYIEENKLIGVHEMVGAGSIELASRVKNVSVLIEKQFKDGKGKEYGEVITHSSIVQKPVVPNQEGFFPIAASTADSADIQPLFFNQTLKDKENPSMDDKQLKEIRKLLNLKDEDELTADNALSVIADKFKSLQTQASKVEELEAKIKELSARKKEPSDNKNDSVMNDELAAQAASLGRERLNLLTEKGKVTPAVRDKLAACLIGEGDNLNKYALSMSTQPDNQSILQKVIDALCENDIVKLGEQTGHQVLALSREAPGATDESEADEQFKLGQEVGKEIAKSM